MPSCYVHGILSAVLFLGAISPGLPAIACAYLGIIPGLALAVFCVETLLAQDPALVRIDIPMTIQIPDVERRKAIASIQRYSLESMDEPIGNMVAGDLLDFLCWRWLHLSITEEWAAREIDCGPG